MGNAWASVGGRRITRIIRSFEYSPSGYSKLGYTEGDTTFAFTTLLNGKYKIDGSYKEYCVGIFIDIYEPKPDTDVYITATMAFKDDPIKREHPGMQGIIDKLERTKKILFATQLNLIGDDIRLDPPPELERHPAVKISTYVNKNDSLDGLVKDFETRVKDVVENLLKKGYNLVDYPISRSYSEIITHPFDECLSKYREQGMEYLRKTIPEIKRLEALDDLKNLRLVKAIDAGTVLTLEYRANGSSLFPNVRQKLINEKIANS